ncbi:serine/threonine protein kinase [Mycobacterium sp. SM1]|uniref:serine/threonine-protein kinase n=1 Tax=Mycobacterium sp. SM1 TaxID=2816243 RepID=UPI001BCC3E8B|nr:serine/threonine-protein kinase [Mycobacterium sp. SM1]MBS4728066.1 serine/threonine protein kinase [Mycobacterium sp. SM1]
MSDTSQGSRVGSQFGRYYLKRLLGRGGMGEVYEAEDTVKERVVALKVLSAALCQDPVFRERLQREARTAGRLQEPHVVPIHDYGEIDGQLYVDMRLIEGTDLATLLKQSGALTPPRAVAIVRQVASALDAAHAAGVIHRDIKPENILITPDDFAYLVDFGIANVTTDDRLTQAGSAVGTWKYTAPERFTNDEVTPSVDVYSLACVLHECLTGSPPYRADSAGMLITAHLMQPIPHPSELQPGVPGAFDAVIERGMAKEPQDRYPSAGELALAAHQALSTRDQDQAGDILKHSQESILHNTEVEPSPAPIPPAPPGPRAPQPPAGRSHPGHGGSEAVPGPAPPSAVGPGWGRGGGPIQPVAGGPPVSPGWGRGGGPIQPTTGGPPAAPPFPPGGGWPGQYRAPQPKPLRRPAAPRKRHPRLLLGAAAAGVAALVGLIIWSREPSHPASTPTITSTTTTATTSFTTPVSTPPAAESQARLFGLLPPGYPPDACKPIAPPKDALAVMSCGANADPGGPPSATYTLLRDLAALRVAFDGIVRSTTVVACPGGIQSPGPWHHNATPQETAGTLVCGFQQERPTLAWTNNAELLVSVIYAGPQEPTLDELYAWWTSHS